MQRTMKCKKFKFMAKFRQKLPWFIYFMSNYTTQSWWLYFGGTHTLNTRHLRRPVWSSLNMYVEYLHHVTFIHNLFHLLSCSRNRKILIEKSWTVTIMASFCVFFVVFMHFIFLDKNRLISLFRLYVRLLVNFNAFANDILKLIKKSSIIRFTANPRILTNTIWYNYMFI